MYLQSKFENEYLLFLFSGGTGIGLKYSLANKLVLNNIHSKLGLDNCLNGLYCGAAPLAAETLEFLKSLGIIVSELYGMTEIPNHTANHYHPGKDYLITLVEAIFNKSRICEKFSLSVNHRDT